jgi:hypothetical protein
MNNLVSREMEARQAKNDLRYSRSTPTVGTKREALEKIGTTMCTL